MTAARQITSDLKGDHLSVRMFGAKGNGAADDTEAIQAAITYGVTNRVAIYLPAGVYKTSGELVIDGPTGVTIYGEDSNNLTSVISYSGTGSAIRATNSASPDAYLHRITLRNLVVISSGSAAAECGLFMEGNVDESSFDHFAVGKSGTGPGFAAGIRFTTLSLSHFRQCSVSNVGIGMDVQTCNGNITVRECNFYQCSVAHFKFGVVTSLVIRDSFFEHSPIGIWQDAASTAGARGFANNVLIEGCHFQLFAAEFPESRWIKMTGTPNDGIQWSLLNNFANFGDGTSDSAYGIELTGGSTLTTLRMYNNTMYGVRTSGVYADSTSSVIGMASQNSIRNQWVGPIVRPLYTGNCDFSALEKSPGRMDFPYGQFRAFNLIQAGDDTATGYVALVAGDSVASGYIDFRLPDGTRPGYIQASPGALAVLMASGSAFEVFGSTILQGLKATTVEASVSVQAGSAAGAAGFISLVPGDATSTGYVDFRLADGTQVGHLAGSAGTIGLILGTGATFGVFGGPTSVQDLSAVSVGIGVTAPTHKLELAVDSAAKPATNTWTVFSDVRLKSNSRPYTKAMDAVRALPAPMMAEYNGENGTPAGMKVIGFNAQEIREVEPSWVSEFRGRIAGVETGVLGVNTGPLVYMLLNALKEMDERVEALEVSLAMLQLEAKT